jgi:peptide/nickel transport system permease protein
MAANLKKLPSPANSSAGDVKSITPLELAWRRFRKNRVGMFGTVVLLLLYSIAIFSGFLSPYPIATQHPGFELQPPQTIEWFHEGGFRGPFVYPVTVKRDPVTFKKIYTADKTSPQNIQFFHKGDEYKFLGLINTDLHLFGVAEGTFFPLGSDKAGRCLLSRMLVGSQVSLTVGVIGILISFSIGILMGGASGYYGGWVDNLIQRIIELLLSFPRLPILLALSYIIPASWPSTYVYLGIVAVLSFIGWAGLARIVRGQVLSSRSLDYVQAARALGAGDLRILIGHIMPNLTSYLIVTATLALPGYILGESALSFLGIGIKEPMTSWGLLLSDARGFETLSQYPWLLWPGAMIVVSVLAFNFAGDALRDAADVTTR